MTPKQLQPQRRCSPTKASFSGKNSERTGSLQPCFRIMGFTREAICCRSGSALSEFFRPVRCVNESTNVCDDMVVVNRNVQYTTAKKWVLYRWRKKDAQAHHRLANGRRRETSGRVAIAQPGGNFRYGFLTVLYFAGSLWFALNHNVEENSSSLYILALQFLHDRKFIQRNLQR